MFRIWLIIVITIAVPVVYLLIRVLMFPMVRRRVAEFVIGQLATVVRQDLPLATSVSLAADGERGMVRKRLNRIAAMLSRGVPLSTAVRLGLPECPATVLSLIMAGERAGQLDVALIQASDYLAQRARLRERIDPTVLPYALLVLGTLLFIMSMLMVVVVPKLVEIMVDFEVESAPALFRVVHCCGPLMEVFWLVFPGLLATVVIGFYFKVRARSTPELSGISRIADWVRWHMPGLRTMQISDGLANMLRTMRFALRAGMAPPQAAALAADIDANWYLRRRMRNFAERIAGGASEPEAARDAELGTVTALAFANGRRSGDMDSALRYAADYYEAMISRFWIALSSLAWPLCTLALAVLVGLFVLTMFQPMWMLLDGVMQTVY